MTEIGSKILTGWSPLIFLGHEVARISFIVTLTVLFILQNYKFQIEVISYARILFKNKMWVEKQTIYFAKTH
jgi:hypothetical protein